MADIKWSAFPNGGAMVTGDQLVGLRSGANTRLTPVIPAQVQQSAFNFAALGGSSNAFTVTLTPAVTALTDGMIVTFYSGAKFNTIAAPTLSVNGLTPVTIVCWSGGLAPNDITTATEYLCIYNLTDNVFQLINPSISSANTFEVQANGYNYAPDTGVANAYIANILPAQISSINGGFFIVMQVLNTNTTASTITVNGTTKNIVTGAGAPLSAGALVANATAFLIYNASYGAFVLLNPASGAVLLAPSGAQTITGFGLTAPSLTAGDLTISGDSLSNASTTVPTSFLTAIPTASYITGFLFGSTVDAVSGITAGSNGAQFANNGSVSSLSVMGYDINNNGLSSSINLIATEATTVGTFSALTLAGAELGKIAFWGTNDTQYTAGPTIIAKNVVATTAAGSPQTSLTFNLAQTGGAPSPALVLSMTGGTGTTHLATFKRNIATAPGASQSAALIVGTAFQNTLGYDVVLTVYLSVTAATSASILLGVGTTTTPTQQTIVNGFTTAIEQIVPVTIYLPAAYYAKLSTSGTITQTISGQQIMPV